MVAFASPLVITTHLLAFSLPFLLALHASPAPDPYPAVVSLPGRQPPPSSRHIARPQATPQVEHDLLPFVLVSTIDGALHAVDREKGDIKWTLREGVDPLVGGAIKGKVGDEEYIVEPLSGSLYVFDQDQNEEGAPRVRKLPLSVEQLIEMSPFTFPHSPSRTFTGSKHTSLLTIDLKTGRQINCYSSLHNTSVSDDCMCDDGEILDDLENKGRSNRDVLFIGRTDYRLTIHSPPNYAESGVVPSAVSEGSAAGRRASGVQEITYSTYTPNNYDKPLAEYWSKFGSGQTFWEADGQPVSKVRVELGHDGLAAGVQQGGVLKWNKHLGSIGIAVYDILLPLVPTNANPILVPQPPPDVLSLFPVQKDSAHSPYDIHAKPPTTYIGSVPPALLLPPARSTGEEDDTPASKVPPTRQGGSRRGSKPLLFALSSESYPLINFAPPPRPGSLANGSFLLSEDVPEQDQLLPYLLDPPAEDMALVPAGETGVVEVPVAPRPQARHNWIWWFVGLLGGLVVCALALTGVYRHRTVKPSGSPAGEKTPLLLGPVEEAKPERPEKTVTIVEPSMTPSARTASLPGDEEATPKKKSTRRRVRGKKKRRDSNAALLDKDGEGEDDDDEDKGELSGSGGSGSVSRRDDKPLPELPREISSTALADEDDKERLAISETIIGFGSHGTVVLKGTWGGRPVAVKRLLSDFTRLASQEVKLLQASDDHPNVIRYYCQERRDNFLYIALDLCQASLADLIEAPDKHIELASELDCKRALSQVTAGLKHLHGMKIIHRDIKPQNVLVSQAKDRSLRMLVSDFGLARRLEQDQSSFAPTANNLAGSLGWRAPECIRGQVRLNEVFDRASSCSSSSGSSSSLLDLTLEADEKDVAKGKGHARLTKAVDLFALGCLYFWVLTSGRHPFGEVYDRESNIVKGEIVNMSQLEILGGEQWEAKDLVGRLLSMDPALRPDTSECLIHPFFWSPSKRLSFLCDASDRFEIMEIEPPEATLVKLETDAVSVVGKDWYSRLDKTVTSNLGKYRKYKGNSVRDLLRAMRNKKHHYQDLEPAVKRHFGELPAGFLLYFTSRYPSLFLHVYSVIRDSRLRHESMFEQYFQEGSS